MTTPLLGPATVAMQATVSVPLLVDEDNEIYVREDGGKKRRFVVDTVTLTYVQDYVEAGSIDEKIGPWRVTAVASGPIVTGGVPGRRTARRTFQEDPAADESTLPEWLGYIVDRYHPAKRS